MLRSGFEAGDRLPASTVGAPKVIDQALPKVVAVVERRAANELSAMVDIVDEDVFAQLVRSKGDPEEELPLDSLHQFLRRFGAWRSILKHLVDGSTGPRP